MFFFFFSNGRISPNETPLPADQAYDLYTKLLPEITRSESLQTLLTANGVRREHAKSRTTRKSRRNLPRDIPVSMLTLRMEEEDTRISTVADREIIIPSAAKNHSEYSLSRQSSATTARRVLSGLSLKPRQGSVKSTAPTTPAGSAGTRRPTSPESTIVDIDNVYDPLGYFSTRARIPDIVSNYSEKGSEEIGSFPTLSETSSMAGDNTCRKSAAAANRLKIPTVEEILKMEAGPPSPMSAAETARAPATSPLLTDNQNENLHDMELRSESPPWLGLFINETLVDDIDTRANSTMRPTSPTSRMASALESPFSP